MNKKKEVSKLIQMATMMSMLQISLLGAQDSKEAFDKTSDDTAEKILKLLGVEEDKVNPINPIVEDVVEEDCKPE